MDRIMVNGHFINLVNLLIKNISKTYPNGVQVLKDGEHKGATPGKVVRGPGYKK